MENVDEEIKQEGEIPQQLVDYGHHFVTDEIFSTRDELMNWARSVALKIGFVVVVYRSDQGGNRGNRKVFLTLGCERSGEYKHAERPRKRKGEVVTGTKKISCPFRLRGRPVGSIGWKLTVLCGQHNHESAETLVGHPYPGRLKCDEKVLVGQMTHNRLMPGTILREIKTRDPDNLTTIKGIYNERQAYRKSLRGPRTEIQHLMMMLESKKYTHFHRKNDSDVVLDIFWAHENSIKLFRTFPTVVLLDTTYKTCRYKLPLLEIVGVTSTERTYCIAFAYTESEHKDNFVWALNCLKKLILHEDGYPEVIVSDRDLALMNAIAVVFPNANHVLCQYHITKNVFAKCKLLVPDNDKCKKIEMLWQGIISSATEVQYHDRLAEFQAYSSEFKEFISYVMDTWLTPWKEHFVAAWIDQYMHIGNTTSNRVEGTHKNLKRQLVDSQGDFCRVFDQLHDLVCGQYTELLYSFEQSKIVVEHRFNKPLFSKLRSVVSRACLEFINLEYERSKNISVLDRPTCSCAVKNTHRIPCACEVANWCRYQLPIPADSVHMHWRKLTVLADSDTFAGTYTGSHTGTQPDLNSDETSRMRIAIDDMWDRFFRLDMTGRNEMVLKVIEIGHPETTSMNPPMDKVSKNKSKKKGSKKEKSTKRDPSYWEHVDSFMDSAPSVDHPGVPNTTRTKTTRSTRTNKKKEQDNGLLYWTDIPPMFRPYVERVIDVISDGNCGYRVIAAELFGDQDKWPLVRQCCYQELLDKHSVYAAAMGSEQRFYQVLDSTQVLSLTSSQPFQKWLTFPDMGLVLATRFQRPLVLLSLRGGTTFLPLLGEPTPSHELMGIMFVQGCHFVQVKLKAYCPLPPISPQWIYYCDSVAHSWRDYYIHRFEAYNRDFHVHQTFVNLNDP